MKDLLKTSGAEITNLKEVLKNWKPSNKIEVVKMLSFISVTNNATVTKKIKDACYEYLNNRCAECENAIDPESGLEVKRIEVNKNIILFCRRDNNCYFFGYGNHVASRCSDCLRGKGCG